MNGTNTKRTVCNRDCPDTCSVLVDVEDGMATALRGDPDDPVTRGFLCERTSRFLKRQYAPDRFLEPMLRVDGRLRPISWDDALDLAAAKLQKARDEAGGASILEYRSGGSLGMLTRLSSHLLRMFGPATTKIGDICSGAGEAAQSADMGVSESHDFFDTLNSRLVIVWGKDVHTSSVHLIPVLKEVQARGGRLVGLDVRTTKAKQLCDDFAVIRPGGDIALAMGMARHLFDTDQTDPEIANYCENLVEYRELVHRHDVGAWAEQAGVDAGWLKSLADAMVQEKPCSIQIGWGMARRKNGAATVRAVDALAAISGNIGITGGGANFLFARSAPFDTDFGLDLPEPPRVFRESLLGQEILEARDPEVRVAWITAGNPVSMLPDSNVVRDALMSRDFVVVVDTHPTDTTDVADLILPTTTLLEDDDVLGAFGNHYLRASTPAIAPPEGVRHELHIVQGLAKRLGLGEVFDGSIRSWKERVTTRIRAAGVSIDTMEKEAALSPFRKPVLFEGRRFPTPSGRFRLMTELPVPEQRDDEYPLRLLATSSPKAQSSQWSIDPRGSADRARVHPEAAQGLRDGERAVLESRAGRIEVTITLDAAQHPSLVYVPKGGMFRYGSCPNALVRAQETDAGGGAAYYDEPVRIRPLNAQ